MDYYVRVGQDGKSLGVWQINETVAKRVGVPFPKESPGCYFEAGPGETPWDALRRGAPTWFDPNSSTPFFKVSLEPGRFYPRIARPIDQHIHEAPGWSPSAHIEKNIVAGARGQLTALTRQLERICQTVQPVPANFECFGHEIRNLLLLACTEVEMHWRGALIANGFDPARRFTTNDYVLLEPAMKLNDYAVDFPQYPWLAPISPFAGWGTTGSPSAELRWYDSYNATKHDRENQFVRATLARAFEALSACVVMMWAQYGMDAIPARSELRSMFQLCSTPKWTPQDIYIYPYEHYALGWEPNTFPF
jgi:hypothetical protein